MDELGAQRAVQECSLHRSGMGRDGSGACLQQHATRHRLRGRATSLQELMGP